MTMRGRRPSWPVWCAVACLSWALSLHAEIFIHEPFSVPGPVPEGWAVITDGASFVPNVIYLDAQEWSAVRLGRSGNTGIVLYDTPSGADVEGSAVFNTGSLMGNAASGATLGFLVRQNRVAFSGTTDPDETGEPGYKLLFGTARSSYAVPGAPYLAIYDGRVALSQQHNPARSEQLAITWLDPHALSGDTDYIFSFSAVGDVVSASLYTMTDPPVLVQTVSLEGVAYTNGGYFGFSASSESSSSRFGYVREVVVGSPGFEPPSPPEPDPGVYVIRKPYVPVIETFDDFDGTAPPNNWILDDLPFRGNRGPHVGSGFSSSGFWRSYRYDMESSGSLGFRGDADLTTGSATAVFRNDTGGPITELLVSYTGEQWKERASRMSSLTFAYSTDGTNFTEIREMQFDAMGYEETSNTWRNGDDEAWRAVRTTRILDLFVEDGEQIYLRWTYDWGDRYLSSLGRQTQGLAIDDLSVTFAPELLTAALRSEKAHFSQAGEVIPFTLKVHNSGLDTVADLELTVSGADVSGGPIALLEPGETDTTTFAVAYTVTGADVASGQITLSATLTAMNADGELFEQVLTETIPFLSNMDGGGDWPMWRHNAGRTAYSPHPLPSSLELHWVRSLPTPRRAWPQQEDDGPKMAFDTSYEPVAADGLLFVGSMVRDRVTAYDLESGEEAWRFYCDGPVRFAPVVAEGKVFVVSDDGYLYALEAQNGELLWKHRGAGVDRKIIGNHRLIDAWPARGAPVYANGVLYYGAGIWPSMDVVIHALHVENNLPLWANRNSGSVSIDQPHARRSASGAAPQGYLVVEDDVLLVPNGRARPGGYDIHSGELLYLDIASRPFGRGWPGQGGYAVMAKNGYFHVTGETMRLSDGAFMTQVTPPILEAGPLQRFRELTRWPRADVVVANDDYLFDYLPGLLTAYAHQPQSSPQVSEPTPSGSTSIHYPLAEQWSLPVDPVVERVFIQAGHRLYGSGPGGRVFAITLHGEGVAPTVTEIGRIEGRVWNMIAASGRLIVVSEAGRMYAFGPGARDVAEYHDPVLATPVVPSTGPYTILMGFGDGSRFEQLLHETTDHILVIEPDEAKVEMLRRQLDASGVYGLRVSVHPGDPAHFAFPPYLSERVYVGDLAAVDVTNPAFAQNLFRTLRPYGGAALLPVSEAEAQQMSERIQEVATQEVPALEVTADGVRLSRNGPLPGAGPWTHHNGNAANTLSSPDELEGPLDVLWFGGPSNHNVLPRHGRGPIPQVVGGRLFILGAHQLGARDVYTGRLLWEKPLPGIGHPYDTTAHQQGADHVGAPYVSVEDGIYVIHENACLRLDPATGVEIARFVLPDRDDETQPASWGFISVWEDLLIAALDVNYFDNNTPGADNSWNATSSGRFVVMNRHSGEVLWSVTASYGFRHNTIAAGAGRLFVMDRLSEGERSLIERRGLEVEDPVLRAYNIYTGATLWERTDGLFGSWLGYSEEHDILIQSGRPAKQDRSQLVGPLGGVDAEPMPGERITAYRGDDGHVLWNRMVGYTNPCILVGDLIVVRSRIFSLLTGADSGTYVAGGNCSQIIAGRRMIGVRQGNAAYVNIKDISETVPVGGVKSGCTPSLVPADGVLNIPDYTRSCICPYPMQTSLALVQSTAHRVEFVPTQVGQWVDGGDLVQWVYDRQSPEPPSIAPAFGWTFTGWSEEPGPVYGHTRHYAVYDAIRAAIGTPYWWLVDKGLVSPDEPAAAFDAAAKSDPLGKGLIVHEEYIAGTDPNDPNSWFRVESRNTSSAGPWPSWQGLAGRTYRVYRNVSLVEGEWEHIDTLLASVDGPMAYEDPAPPEGVVFYRIGVHLSP